MIGKLTVWVLNFCVLKIELLHLFSDCSYNLNNLNAEVSHIFIQTLVILKCHFNVCVQKKFPLLGVIG